MNFKKLIERYKEGIATEEEINIIEKEIEKYEAIEEYLADSVVLDFISPDDRGQDKDESQNLRKSVDKRLRKVVLSSVSIVLAIYLCLFYVISPIVDNLYYNPTKVSIGERNQDLFYDLSVFIELNMPGYTVSSPKNAEGLGFGEYNIYVGRSKQLTLEREVINMKLERGRSINMNESLYPRSFVYFPGYTDSETFDEESIKRSNELGMNHLKQLNPVSYVSAYLTFNRDLNMEEFHELIWDNGAIKFIWAGIRTEGHDENNIALTGFRLNQTAVPQTGDLPNKERYPAFDLYGWIYDTPNPHNWPEAYELHYKSLLQYMVDREKAVLAFEHSTVKSKFYKSALEYVEENGVNTFGVMVFAEPKDLIEFVENESVKAIQVDEVLASKRFIH